jgi:D-arabinose 5-phosphate isomerase GutQ
MVQQCSQQRPVQNSEVYVLRQVPPFPPLSPPSPITPAEDFDDATIDARTLTQPDIAVCGKKLAIEERLSRAVHVLATETSALQNLTELYSSDRCARDGFTRAVDAITRTQGTSGGKVVVIGVGKSGHIAKKVVATFNSLAIQAVFLHPTEALHGDLGQISRHDTLLLITFSGKTPELLTLLPHLDRSLPLILLTSHTRPETCDLIRHRPDTILLPAPIHEAETTSFGVAAPTTSTTVALTVGDALAIVASRELHPCIASVFARNHPGGAIGAALRAGAAAKPREDVRAVMVPLDSIAALPSPTAATAPTTGLDVLRAGYASPSGWVKLPQMGGGVVSPRKIRRLGVEDMARAVAGELRWAVTPRSAFIPVAADTSVLRAGEWVRGLRAATVTAEGDGGAVGSDGGDGGGDGGVVDQGPYGDEAIVAVMERGECIGLVEVGRLLEEV